MVFYGAIENALEELYIVCPGLTLNCITDIMRVVINRFAVIYNYSRSAARYNLSAKGFSRT